MPKRILREFTPPHSISAQAYQLEWDLAVGTQDRLAGVSIQFPELHGARMRKVVSRSRARPTGKFPSWKMGRMLQWESPHELNAFRLLDADPSIIGFQEQPVEIGFDLNGVRRRHIPDLMVQFARRTEFWEIKASLSHVDPDTAARTSLLKEELPPLGYSYKLILGSQLAQQPDLSNAILLLRFGREGIDPVDRERVRLAFKRSGTLTWTQLLRYLANPKGLQNVCRLALEGWIHFDRSQPLNEEAGLSWGRPPSHSLEA